MFRQRNLNMLMHDIRQSHQQ
ncbi:MAG: hypothetical protein CG438_493, partial [Methylococcaceae bacterium NSP1-1]